MDLLATLDALLKEIEAEAKAAQAKAKAAGERIDSGEAHKRAIDNMIEGKTSK